VGEREREEERGERETRGYEPFALHAPPDSKPCCRQNLWAPGLGGSGWGEDALHAVVVRLVHGWGLRLGVGIFLFVSGTEGLGLGSGFRSQSLGFRAWDSGSRV